MLKASALHSFAFEALTFLLSRKYNSTNVKITYI